MHASFFFFNFRISRLPISKIGLGTKGGRTGGTCGRVWVCEISRWEKKNDEERLRPRRSCVRRRERRRRFRRFSVRYLPAFFVLQRGIKPDAHSSRTTFVRGIRFLRKISSALKRILRQILLSARVRALDPTAPASLPSSPSLWMVFTFPFVAPSNYYSRRLIG